MANQAQASGRGRTIGWVLSGLVIAFLLMDATMKLLALPVVLETQEPLGFSGPTIARGLGVLLLACGFSTPRRRPRCSARSYSRAISAAPS